MKIFKYISVLVLLFCTTLSFAQSTVGSASEAYRSEDYKKSIQLYEQVVAQQISEGKESAEIYYNLGNAYFRNGETAKAILNYERALLLNPGDSDIRHNLRFARTRIEDKIDTSDSFFLTNWINGLKNLFSSNTWASIAIAFFIAFLVCIATFLFVRRMWIKKTTFYAAIVIFVFLIIANMFAFSQKNSRINRNTGIIMAASTSIMTSPDANSQELFRLHEGTKVKLNKTDGNWIEIEIANGSVGWTSKENVEII
ncbi:MAG: tetratricopeptide repeat protein [Bacteroidia bacterium]|nr:tetratricopeptide repeat protein [Bacteroidia bacterium]